MRLKIRSLTEYEQYKAGWVEPLILPYLFEIEPKARKVIIESLFGKASPENDQKFYRWIWEIKPHWCEECGKPLRNYWSGYVSHIKSRGAWTEFRYDPLNVNILCDVCHNKWENGTLEEKEKMYVYWKNKSLESLQCIINNIN